MLASQTAFQNGANISVALNLTKLRQFVCYAILKSFTCVFGGDGVSFGDLALGRLKFGRKCNFDIEKQILLLFIYQTYTDIVVKIKSWHCTIFWL